MLEMTSSVFPSHYIYHPALHPHHPSLFDLTTSASDLSFIDGKPSSLLSSHPFHRYFVAGDGLKKVSDASKPSGKSFTIDSILARSDRLSHEKLMATHSESKGKKSVFITALNLPFSAVIVVPSNKEGISETINRSDTLSGDISDKTCM